MKKLERVYRKNMKIDFEKDFNDYILSRGYEYYLDNKVNNVKIDNETATAVVRGSGNYNVIVKVDNGIFIDGECNCPYFGSGKYCKHVAALLYYLNNNDKGKATNNNIEDIVNSVNDTKLRKFVYDNLMNDSDLLNKFRVEFSEYFPKLTKQNYISKIYSAINNCYDRHGFIDYNNTYNYEHAMFEYIIEARKLVEDSDYNTAFTIATIILDSIPDTAIDDSDGTTSDIADSCIEILQSILNKVTDKESIILKNILDYIINEVKTAHLYNYGIDLKDLLKYYIDNDMYLKDIEISLETALDMSKDKSYFYSRKYYIEYLIQIYELNNQNDKIISLLEKYSFDQNICMEYIDKLIENNQVETAINILKGKLDEKDYRSRNYAKKLTQIYLDNNMNNEYKDMLYDMFYKYDKYDFDTYLKIKNLYSSDEWNTEKNKIIEIMKKDSYSNRDLNKIYIEEKMIDELFQNVCNYRMDHIEEYEKELLPKYNKELLNIYMKSCLIDAERANNRKAYRDVAIKINHIIKMQDSNDIVKELLKEINEKYFRSRTAMVDEFNGIIKNLNEYIK